MPGHSINLCNVKHYYCQKENNQRRDLKTGAVTKRRGAFVSMFFKPFSFQRTYIDQCCSIGPVICLLRYLQHVLSVNIFTNQQWVNEVSLNLDPSFHLFLHNPGGSLHFQKKRMLKRHLGINWKLQKYSCLVTRRLRWFFMWCIKSPEVTENSATVIVHYPHFTQSALYECWLFQEVKHYMGCCNIYTDI